MSEDTGGPAFPTPGTNTIGSGGGTYIIPHPGMTLRDWFAGQALAQWAVGDEDVARLNRGDKVNYPLIAKTCFEMADAMIAERSK